jgi:hypothetical protein
LGKLRPILDMTKLERKEKINKNKKNKTNSTCDEAQTSTINK